MRINNSGFKRNDTSPEKLRYDLIPTWLLADLAALYAEGASKFGERNWEKANAEEDIVSFKASAFRHFMEYMNGAENEDHLARTVFNLAGIKHVKKQQNEKD